MDLSLQPKSHGTNILSVLWQVTKGYPLESNPVTVETCVILPFFS